ncbi:transcriptional regulator, AlpA family [Ferrimonas sediminum]|uniref:Transcriptional regulator, AlpA family n=1 Tax=Ferrimonas sediminum TaxID=718193 RepID=A0A1G8PYL0_9GAMM|nr:AlpA family phage regulatory protein [Ferrimonas sediminum]SDI97346.1 transcriptional regulator, AlpA family [Ferrimonas sediminum]
MTVRFIKIKDIVNTTSLSESNIYARMASGNFPKSIKLGPRTSVWVESEVQAWMEQQIPSRPQEEEV